MKFMFICVDDTAHIANIPDFNSVEQLVNSIIARKANWITDAIQGIAIQVDKIISIREVRDE